MIDPPTAEPLPGLYPGVPKEDYLGWPHVNNSLLCEALLNDGTVSMKHLKACLDDGGEVTSKDMAYGAAIHTRLLEPSKFVERHPIAGQCQATKQDGEPCIFQGLVKWNGHWYCKVHAADGAEAPPGTITSLEAALIEELVVEIQQHPAVKLLKAQGGVEVSFIWDQPVSYFVQGQERHAVIRMKGRVDKDIPQPKSIPPCCVDLKKVQRGQHTDTVFARSIKKWHYDTQAGLYVDGLKAVDGIERQFVWVVLEDGRPFDLNCIQADVETLEAGRTKYRRLLSLYAAALDTGLWPGGYPNIHRGGLSWWDKHEYAQTEGT